MHPCVHSYMHYIMKAATDPSSGPTLWPSVNVLLPRSVGNKVIIHGRTPVHQEVESIPRGTWAALICRLQKQTAHFKNHLVHWSSGPQRPTISNCLAFTFRIFSDLFGNSQAFSGIWRVTTTPKTAIPPFVSFVKWEAKHHGTVVLPPLQFLAQDLRSPEQKEADEWKSKGLWWEMNSSMRWKMGGFTSKNLDLTCWWFFSDSISKNWDWRTTNIDLQFQKLLVISPAKVSVGEHDKLSSFGFSWSANYQDFDSKILQSL